MKPILQLAPIKGKTDRTFRCAFAKFFEGLDSALAPFVRLSDSESKIKSLSPELNPGLRTVPQILTKSPQEFLALADKLKQYGCDEVNWNLGCPFAVVVKRGEGAAMLQNPELIASFLDKVFADITLPVSIKMRVGMHSPDEILKLAPILNAYPLKEIVIHPRTGEQMYDGTLYLDAFASALALSVHPVIYNGDITTVSDYERLTASFPSVRGYMIGRGLLMNPLLATEIINGSSENDTKKIERVRQFMEYLLDAYIQDLQSPAHVLDKMRGIWFYLAHYFSDSRKVEKRIRKAGSIKHYQEEVRRVFDASDSIQALD